MSRSPVHRYGSILKTKGDFPFRVKDRKRLSSQPFPDNTAFSPKWVVCGWKMIDWNRAEKSTAVHISRSREQAFKIRHHQAIQPTARQDPETNQGTSVLRIKK